MYKESEPLSDLASAFERDGGAEPLEVKGGRGSMSGGYLRHDNVSWLLCWLHALGAGLAIALTALLGRLVRRRRCTRSRPLLVHAHQSAPTPPQSPPQIRVPAHCLTSNNRHVRARQLWGCDVYTQDSDMVAVLMHCGYWSLFRTFGFLRGGGRGEGAG